MTLIEILVVVSIIVLLVGLALGGYNLAFEAQEVKRTRVAMQQALLAMTEYEATTTRLIEFSKVSDPQDESVIYFMSYIRQVPEARKVLMTIGNDLLEDIDDDAEPDRIIDPWGTPLQYRSWWDGGAAFSSAGSGENLPKYGSPNSARPFFASAGPDRKFGTDDDIYSFNIE